MTLQKKRTAKEAENKGFKEKLGTLRVLHAEKDLITTDSRIKSMGRRSPFKYLPFLLLCFWLAASVSPAQAHTQQQPGLAVTARAGYDGFYKAAYWMPVFVTLANSGPPVEGELRIIDEAPISDEDTIYRTPISLPTQSNKRVALYVYLPNARTNLRVALVDGDDNVIYESATNDLTRQPDDEILYGVVSPDPGEFAFLENVVGRRPGAATAFLGLEDLPEVSAAWNALDVLVLNDVDAAQISPAQRQALEAWLSTGGQLVVTGGANWQKTTAGLEDLLPVTASGSESMADLPALAALVGEPFRDPGPYLVTTSSLTRGELIYHENGLPLLARTQHGRGDVYFLALDPRFAPLLDWDGAETIFTAVANRVSPPTIWGAPPQTGFAARNAVTSLPDLNLPSVWQMALFLLLYTVVVGPMNYWLLKRRRKLELAWLSIPLFILGFTAVTYFTGFQLRGNAVIINQMSVAYSHVDGEQARVHSLVGLYSPRRTAYDLLFPADTLTRPFSEGTFRQTPNLDAISYSGQNSLDGVRVDVSDIEPFIAQTDRPALALAAEGTLNRETNRIRLNASVQNNSDVTLEGVVFIIGNNVISLGNLEPGEVEPVSSILSGAASGNAPLTSRANIILGLDYFNDPVLYPRYQLLEAIEGDRFSGSTLPLPTDAALLLGWTEDPLISITTNKGRVEQINTNLHIMEIPLASDLTRQSDAGALELPPFLLDWHVLESTTNAVPAISDLDLNGGWVSFEFQPHESFQDAGLQELAIHLEKNVATASVPALWLWHWAGERWVELDEVAWGKMVIANPAAYLGEGNRLRLKLQDNGNNTRVTAVYPIYTLNME